jgi:hypothetical protein
MRPWPTRRITDITSSTLARHLVEQMGHARVYNARNAITQWGSDGRTVTRQ